MNVELNQYRISQKNSKKNSVIHLCSSGKQHEKSGFYNTK